MVFFQYFQPTKSWHYSNALNQPKVIIIPMFITNQKLTLFQPPIAVLSRISWNHKIFFNDFQICKPIEGLLCDFSSDQIYAQIPPRYCYINYKKNLTKNVFIPRYKLIIQWPPRYNTTWLQSQEIPRKRCRIKNTDPLATSLQSQKIYSSLCHFTAPLIRFLWTLWAQGWWMYIFIVFFFQIDQFYDR